MLSTLVIFFCLCRTEPLRSWAEDPTELVSRENSKGAQQSRGAGDHSGRSSPGHGGVNRAVLGGGLTIDTLPDNMTHVVEDPGKYYTWQSFGPENERTKEVWVDMSDARHGQVRVHGILSNSYQQAVKVALSFDFPFYGHNLRQITIATGGFIFTGDLTHRMLTTTQYIAPLMANFDPGHTKESTVQYLDNGEVFVVQWEKVRLAGKESEGAFTFQAALHKTGDITFSYKDIPLPLTVMNTPEHPVKTGLSDAFMVTTPTQSTGPQRQTIYEYHRIDIDLSTITSSSAVEFTALATCLQHKNCESCVSSKQTSGCSWCNVLQRCSDGMDRHRQEWLDYACLEESEDTTCEVYTGDYSSLTPEMEDVTSPAKSVVCKHNDDATDSDGDAKTASSTTTHQWPNMGVIAGIAAALVLLLALVLVTVYISFNPSVASPFYLTHRRKSYWPSMKFQKQQSGYTEVEGSGRESFVEAPPC